MKEIFALWAILGYLVITLFPKPKTRTDGIVQLIIGGPLAWVGFVLITIRDRKWRIIHNGIR